MKNILMVSFYGIVLSANVAFVSTIFLHNEWNPVTLLLGGLFSINALIMIPPFLKNANELVK